MSDAEKPRRRRPVIETVQDAPTAAGADRSARAGAVLEPAVEEAGADPRRDAAARQAAAASEEASSPQDAPPPDDDAPLAAGTQAPRRGSLWLRLALWSGGLLATAAIVVGAADLVQDFMARNVWLGRVALLVLGVFVAALLALAVKELAALGRLKRLAEIRRLAETAREVDAPAAAAKEMFAALDQLYRDREDLAWARDRLRDRVGDAVDLDARLDLYERELMGPLDAQARSAAAEAARRVATATALAPSALLDAAAALYFNLRMVRRMAEIYGGRAGVAGTARLVRMVVMQAMAAGLIALGDDLLEPLIGGGVASRLSRKAGEGVVNGALTARLGVAAMTACRPMPFSALDKPSVRSLGWDALRGR